MILKIYVTEEVLYFNKTLEADRSIIKMYFVFSNTISVEISAFDKIKVMHDVLPNLNEEPKLKYTMEYKVPYECYVTRKYNSDIENRICSKLISMQYSDICFQILFEFDGFEKYQLVYKAHDFKSSCHWTNGQLVIKRV